MEKEAETKNALQALQASEIRYRRLFETAQDGILILNAETGEIDDVNPYMIDMLHYSREEFLGMKLWEVSPFKDTVLNRDAFKELQDKGYIRYKDLPLETKEGKLIAVEFVSNVYKVNGNKVIQCNIRNITDRKRVEEELKTSYQQLRNLAKRQQQVREEARLMIAREIHDELGGGLAGLKMELISSLHKVYDTEAGRERIALMSNIHVLNKLIDQMIQTVRRITTELRPSVLDDLGLVAALEWQLKEFTSHTEIPHEFVTALDYANLGKDTSVAVFRIFQETLTNVARHSGATKVTVLLREEKRSFFECDSLCLEISDNGRGITEDEILDTKSLGILGMKERTLVFGGDLRISGDPDSGTTVILKIPQNPGETS